jgi:hypothetical protein
MEADRLSQSNDGTRPPMPARAIASVLAALLAGGVLRGWMLHKFFEVSGDSCLYGGMAKNLILHGQYALTDGSGALHPTLMRLPGYPLFLALCFRLFGMENYFSASCVQIALALLSCWLLFLFVYRLTPEKHRMSAAQATLWLAALCPFTAIYDAEPLTESLSLFCLSLALWSLARFCDRFQRDHPDWLSALAFTFAVMYSALLRPDGALVGVAFVPPIVLAFRHRANTAPYPSIPDLARMVTTCLLLALAPFAVWSYRNWRAFHVIQPLAPRYANDPGEDTWPGWQRWMKTWCLDFVSTYDIYWNVPGSPLDLSKLPDRAFDSFQQFTETARLAAAYEANGEELSNPIDDGFAQLAAERIASHPLRYYLWLPLGRVADMWLRPRVENLPIDLDWWVYRHHYAETRFSWCYAGLNAFYLLLAIVGLCLRPRFWPWMLAYMLMRSALLATIEAPEARYTIECFPMLFALAGIALGRVYSRTTRR